MAGAARVYEPRRQPFKPQTVLLRLAGPPQGEPVLALARHLLCLRSPAVAQGHGAQAVLDLKCRGWALE